MIYMQKLWIIAVALFLGVVVFGTTVVLGQGCIDVGPEVLSWWSGNDTALDMAGTNNGTLMNGATYAAGKVGRAFSFDGVNDYLVAPDTGLPAGNSARTLVFWMKSSTQQDGKSPVIYGTWSAESAFYVSLFGDKACIGGWNGFSEVCGTRTVIDDNWHFVALTYNSGTANLYVDGDPVPSATVTRTYSTVLSGNVYIGGIPSIHYTGLVDEVAIASVAVPGDDLVSVFNAGSAGFCPMTDPFRLRQGWNFISFPKIPPVGIAAALGNQTSNVLVVWGYDNKEQTWLKWKPSGGGSNTLQSFEIGKGYWIYALNPGTIDVSQWQQAPDTAPFVFERGWNLIGYNGTNGLLLGDGLQAISGQWSIVWNWAFGTWGAQSTAIFGLPTTIGPLTHLYQGLAYWVKVKDSYTGPPPGVWDQSSWDMSVWGQ
jgi:hypothetical protein